MKHPSHPAEILFLAAPLSHASDICAAWTAKAISIQGQVNVYRANQSAWKPVLAEDIFCSGDRIRIEKRSRAALLMPNQTLLRLDAETTLFATLSE